MNPETETNQGFTLLELMITVVILLILLGILAPFLQNLLGLTRLNVVTSALGQHWKITRFDATGNGSSPKTLCMNDTTQGIDIASISGSDCESVTVWHSLPTGVSIDVDNSTLRTQTGVAGNGGNIYRVSWADTRGGLGASWGQLGRLVLVADGTNAKKCLFLFDTQGNWNIRTDTQCNRN